MDGTLGAFFIFILRLVVLLVFAVLVVSFLSPIVTITLPVIVLNFIISQFMSNDRRMAALEKQIFELRQRLPKYEI
jgi:hypothetical protein